MVSGIKSMNRLLGKTPAGYCPSFQLARQTTSLSSLALLTIISMMLGFCLWGAGDHPEVIAKVRQFLADHPGNETAMSAALLIDYYGFSDDEKIEALTPRLEADDARLRDRIWEVLGTVDRPEGAREAVGRVQRLERRLPSVDWSSEVELDEVRQEIEVLSRDEIWWIRLYAAHAVRSHPQLGPGVAERLRDDADPRVRRAVE